MKTDMPLLQVRACSAGYGPRSVLSDISLHVFANEMVALIGANGAGKTTLMRTLLGVLRPMTGSIAVDGIDLTASRPERRVRAGISLSPEGRIVCPDLSVLDNMRLGAHVRCLSRQALARDIDEMCTLFAPLKSRLQQAAGTLSGGEQQMVAMARALMARPRLLLLDEPTLGLSPAMVETVFAILQSLPQRGVAVLMAEQQAGAALQMATRGYVLVNGNIVQEGSAAALLTDVKLQRAFLGST